MKEIKLSEKEQQATITALHIAIQVVSNRRYRLGKCLESDFGCDNETLCEVYFQIDREYNSMNDLLNTLNN
tara:strand:+ start:889 stop:1101 length:213 start_codon:yes stop_codon:yes gene_type:complete